MDDDKEFRSRDFDPIAHQRYLDGLHHRLADAERKTDPRLEGSASEKDYEAFSSLYEAGHLVEAVAGWALDHVCGLSLAGERMLPLQPNDVRPEKGKNQPYYVRYRAFADSHDHEREGRDAFLRPPASPAVRRLILRNLVFAGGAGWPSWLRQELFEALDALDAGKTMPLLEARRKQGTPIETAKMMLQFVVFVKYQSRAYGIKQDKVREDIERMTGIQVETLKSWEQRLKQSSLGALEVDRQISFARNAASYTHAAMVKMREEGTNSLGNVAENAERKYGHEALAALVERWRRMTGELPRMQKQGRFAPV